MRYVSRYTPPQFYTVVLRHKGLLYQYSVGLSKPPRDKRKARTAAANSARVIAARDHDIKPRAFKLHSVKEREAAGGTPNTFGKVL